MADTTSTKEPTIAPPTIRMLGKSGRSASSKRRSCQFCAKDAALIDYKNPTMLKNFVTDRGKMLPRRINGACAKHQRALAVAIRRARVIALLPFTVTGK